MGVRKAMSVFDGQGVEVQSLTKAGVILVVYLFVVLITYFALSGPINALYDAFQGANWAAAESHKVAYMALIRQTTLIVFAVFISIPITWFFFWVFHREPAYVDYNPNQWRR
jgi:hypothetical protein